MSAPIQGVIFSSSVPGKKPMSSMLLEQQLELQLLVSGVGGLSALGA